MKVSMHVLKAGALTTLQDLGRHGVAASGFSKGGAMDHYAARAANALVDNPPEAALLEVALGGLQFEVDGPVDIAICGAEAPLQINTRYVESWRTHALEAGDVVSVGYAQRGTRLYIAFAGGMDVPPVLGSASTVLREGVGGVDGRALRVGDAVSLLPRSLPMQPRRFSVKDRYRFTTDVILAASQGPQWHMLDRQAKRLLLTSTYTVTAQSDRMGYRLDTDKPMPALAGVISEGLGVGAVQLPNDGQPIVLMRDHQTMGGYPKPLVLLPESVDLLAQCPPGCRVRFKLLSAGESTRRFLQYQQRLQKMPWEYV